MLAALWNLVSGIQRRWEFASVAKIRDAFVRIRHAIMDPIRQSQRVRNFLLRVNDWGLKYPRVKVIVDELFYALQCLAVATGEEVAKRATPWFFSSLFGAVEGIVVAARRAIVATGLEEADSAAGVYAIHTVAFHTFLHTLFRVLPLWISIPAHALYNWFTGRSEWHKRRYWRDLVSEFEEFYVPDPPMVPMTVPKNRVSESEIYWKTSDGSRMYIRDDPVYLMILDKPLASAKPIVVDSDASRLLVKPSATLLDFVTMEVARLQKPLPYEANARKWKVAFDVFMHVFLEPLKHSKGVLQVLDLDALENYVDSRPWNKRRKEEYHVVIEKKRRGAELSKRAGKTCKGDEILPTQPSLACEGESASKTRPIDPKTEADVMTMRLAVPLKKYLGDLRFWRWSSLGDGVDGWEECGRTSASWVLSIYYCWNPHAGRITDWMRDVQRINGIHFCMHGNDQYTLYVKDGKFFACASDMVSCDKSCTVPFQRHFAEMCDFLTSESHRDIVAAQKAALTGEFKLKSRKLDPSLPDLYWEKKDVSTKTGECLTSSKAVFGQQVAIFAAVARCVRGGEFEMDLYPTAVKDVYKDLGLVPEFETSPDGETWHHPSAVTFLGGMFVEEEWGCGWTWVANKFLKAWFIFPDTKTIYGHDQPHVQMHMATLLSDPDLPATPVGRALRDWFRSVVEKTFGQDSHVFESAYSKYFQWLQRTDSYKLELRDNHEFRAEQYARAYSSPVVNDAAFYAAANQMMDRCGYTNKLGDLFALVNEIKSFNTDISQKLCTSALPLYVLRFGLPKPATSEEENLLVPLNLVGHCLSLGQKIYSFVMSTSTKKPVAKPPAKSAAKATKS